MLISMHWRQNDHHVIIPTAMKMMSRIPPECRWLHLLFLMVKFISLPVDSKILPERISGPPGR